ncbi:hypothetical protein RHMOL_Rhmol13G0283300 [Rhododendron molle]|uniref:Uncharacterized protein n=1 Tax=Rhododendron molle TaxID=49168 RepID=A0ACC0LCP8_RHOML|nr:hypothetical protein RHMOL_Rhmol13G0283300 [Rhododendron molle]
MENWAKKNEEEENQFQRLPDDVAVNIFDKVSDIKWLCRSFVVCKRFASLIPLVQKVSIKANAGDYLSIPRDFHKLPSSPFNVWGTDIFAKLTQIRSLNLDLVSDFVANNDSVFKWGAKLSSDFDSLTLLYAASLSKMKESEEEKKEEDDETENEITQEEQICRLHLAFDCAKEAMLWLRILCRVILKYPMLQSITITDSMNKGVRLYLGGEKLVECRNAIMCPEEAVPRQESVRVGSVPVLQLPKSGYVMKGVTIVHLSSGDDSESDAQLAMVDAFAEEQGVFSEAVVQILKDYKDGNKMFQH